MKHLKKKIELVMFRRFLNSNNFVIFFSDIEKLSGRENKVKTKVTSFYLMNYLLKILNVRDFRSNNFLFTQCFDTSVSYKKFLTRNSDRISFFKFKNLYFSDINYALNSIFKVLNVFSFLVSLRSLVLKRLHLLFYLVNKY
jgi:hypothetical protein